MWSLFITVLFIATPVSSQNLEQKEVPWWREYIKAEVLVALGIPVLGGFIWLLRDYSEKASMVARQQFKEELISSLQETLKEALAEREKLWEVRLHPINNALSSLSKTLKQNGQDNIANENSIEVIQAMVNANQVRLTEVEKRLDAMIEKMKKELYELHRVIVDTPHRS